MNTAKYNTANPLTYGLLRENAMRNKRNPTEAESIMWTLLRRKQLGVIFRRQYIIDEFIVDFVCLSKQLIIEVDGKYHNLAEQKEADRIREERLCSMGFRIIRFTNEEILVFPEQVICKIKNELNNDIL